MITGMSPKVSVVVPIYNVEKYIERCVRSLMEQTLQDIEYIFVNDCTPDQSVEVLQRVLLEYPHRTQVKIVSHEENRGSAAVRNTGLDTSIGEYIIYCDSDDWVDKPMYETMYNRAKEVNADIVVVDYCYEFHSYSIVQKQPFPSEGLEAVRQMLAGSLHCGTCNKMVRRELFLKNGIHFPNGINMWEDVLTTIPLCYYASNIIYIPKAFYHYAQFNSNSYTQCVSECSLQNMIAAVNQMEKFLSKNRLDKFDKEFCFMKLTVKLNLLLNTNGKQQKLRSKIYPEANKYIFSYNSMSLYWRIGLKFVSWNMLYMFNIMNLLNKKLRICRK